MDIKEQINKIADRIKKEPDIAALFKKEPVKAIEKVLGVDLPDEVVEKIIDGVKAKISVDKASNALGKLKKLF